jgi:hypothetical protein
MFKKIKEYLFINKSIATKEQYLKELETQINDKEKFIEETKAEVKLSFQSEGEAIVLSATEEANKILKESSSEIEKMSNSKEQVLSEINQLNITFDSLREEIAKQEKTAIKYKIECQGIRKLVNLFPEAIKFEYIEEELKLFEESYGDGLLDTVTHLDFHFKDSKLLKKDMNANNSEIKKLLKTYQARYTTKANQAIYNLMVIGLQAELQNILYTLSYTNLEKALENASVLIKKYLTICGNGNGSILPTITKFLFELEPLFVNAIQIEYRYYFQKEKEKEEQKRIKEQMRQEAEEQRILEQEKRKIEKEEEKYKNEINNYNELLKNETDNEKILALEARLKELHDQVAKLEEQKEEIVKRANGRAGYVYVISNLGSFGENMFKVGMTRRLNPLERIDELGDASVPFKFDIHAMIFSDNAVDLEQRLHQILDQKRVNKINLRKEFFYSGVENLQNIVQEIDSTVEFTLTMRALEYRQSISVDDEVLQGA